MSRLERYHQYRAQGRALHSKLLDASLDRDTIDETARVLDLLGEDDTVVYETDAEQNAHMDFVLYEHPQDDQTPVDRFHADENGDSELEHDLLDAMIASTPTRTQPDSSSKTFSARGPTSS